MQFCSFTKIFQVKISTILLLNQLYVLYAIIIIVYAKHYENWKQMILYFYTKH